MRLSDILLKNKSALSDMWFEVLLKSYPADTYVFMRDQKKQFANPVGYTMSNELEKILSGLLSNAEIKSLTPHLENIIKIRAVQGLMPSQALSFVFLLKDIIRGQIRGDMSVKEHELKEIELRIDSLALLALTFMACREKIYELKASGGEEHDLQAAAEGKAGLRGRGLGKVTFVRNNSAEVRGKNMGSVFSLIAVIVLILIAHAGAGAANLHYLFGVVALCCCSRFHRLYIPHPEVGECAGTVPHTDNSAAAEIPAVIKHNKIENPRARSGCCEDGH